MIATKSSQNSLTQKCCQELPAKEVQIATELPFNGEHKSAVEAGDEESVDERRLDVRRVDHQYVVLRNRFKHEMQQNGRQGDLR